MSVFLFKFSYLFLELGLGFKVSRHGGPLLILGGKKNIVRFPALILLALHSLNRLYVWLLTFGLFVSIILFRLLGRWRFLRFGPLPNLLPTRSKHLFFGYL